MENTIEIIQAVARAAIARPMYLNRVGERDKCAYRLLCAFISELERRKKIKRVSTKTRSCVIVPLSIINRYERTRIREQRFYAYIVAYGDGKDATLLILDAGLAYDLWCKVMGAICVSFPNTQDYCLPMCLSRLCTSFWAGPGPLNAFCSELLLVSEEHMWMSQLCDESLLESARLYVASVNEETSSSRVRKRMRVEINGDDGANCDYSLPYTQHLRDGSVWVNTSSLPLHTGDVSRVRAAFCTRAFVRYIMISGRRESELICSIERTRTSIEPLAAKICDMDVAEIICESKRAFDSHSRSLNSCEPSIEFVQQVYELVLLGAQSARAADMRGNIADEYVNRVHASIRKHAFRMACRYYNMLYLAAPPNDVVTECVRRCVHLEGDASETDIRVAQRVVRAYFDAPSLLYYCHVMPASSNKKLSLVDVCVTNGCERALSLARLLKMPLQVAAIEALCRSAEVERWNLVSVSPIVSSGQESRPFIYSEVASALRSCVPVAREGRDFVCAHSLVRPHIFVVLMKGVDWNTLSYGKTAGDICERNRYNKHSEPNVGDTLARTFDAFAKKECSSRAASIALRALAVLLQQRCVPEVYFEAERVLPAIARVERILSLYAKNAYDFVTILYGGFSRGSLSSLFITLENALAPRAQDVFMCMNGNTGADRVPEWLSEHKSVWAAFFDHDVNARTQPLYDLVRKTNNALGVASLHDTRYNRDDHGREDAPKTSLSREALKPTFYAVGLHGKSFLASAIGCISKSAGEFAIMRSASAKSVAEADERLHLVLLDAMLYKSESPAGLLRDLRIFRVSDRNEMLYRIPLPPVIPGAYKHLQMVDDTDASAKPEQAEFELRALSPLTIGSFARILTCVRDAHASGFSLTRTYEHVRSSVGVTPTYGESLCGLRVPELAGSNACSYGVETERLMCDYLPRPLIFASPQDACVEGCMSNFYYSDERL